MTAFDEATAVSRRGEGLYDVRPDARFALVAPGGGTAPPAVNGGVLMATVLRAVLDGSDQPHPISMNAGFLRVAQLAPAQVEVTWLKRGRTASTARATLVQDGKAVLDTTITTGTLPDRAADGGQAGAAEPGPEALDWTGPRPSFPDIADCVDLGRWPGSVAADGSAGFPGHVEVLLDPACTGWRHGEPSGLAEIRGYVQLRDRRDPDALMLAVAVDSLPPVVFGLGATGWSPTVELTWHMRAVPAPGPLQVECRTRHVSGGWFDEEAEVWDSAGRLVAQGTQMARVGRGRLRPMLNGSNVRVTAPPPLVS
jgi:acyl-coenzyme A thioesterase PaaI-like protein